MQFQTKKCFMLNMEYFTWHCVVLYTGTLSGETTLSSFLHPFSMGISAIGLNERNYSFMSIHLSVKSRPHFGKVLYSGEAIR